MPGSNLSQNLSESQLKKVYLQFAKVYHPDVKSTGDKIKFQKLTAAYDRLKADKAGYTLTEEDLYDLYKNKQKQENRQKSAQEEYADAESETNYKTNEELKKEFEDWKRQATTEYDEKKHDEFLKNRYYKMHNQQDFSTSSHFSHPNSEAGPRNGPQ